jgi:AcrR family transcriptional regulator
MPPTKNRPKTPAKSGGTRTSRGAKWNNAVPSRIEQQAAKRQAVIYEAGRAFRRRGFHNTSLDEVAEALNIAKPTLYSYFSNKQEVLYECLKAAMDLGDVSVGVAESERTGLKRIERFLRHYIEALTSDFGACAVLNDLFALEPAQQKEIAGRRDRFDKLFRRWVEEGIADGSIRSIDPTLAVACFMGTVNWIPAWFSPAGSKQPMEVAEAFTRVLISGLGGA